MHQDGVVAAPMIAKAEAQYAGNAKESVSCKF
jgi:hypothetical protein